MISATSAVFLFYSVMLGVRVLISCDYTFNHNPSDELYGFHGLFTSCDPNFSKCRGAICVDQVFQLLVSIHATASYQNNASTDYKDCTDDVEDCGTDATSGRKNGTLVVKDVR